ncbi:MAG: hypothetical protein P4L85_25690 [Paludisphaera borealis]|uniref:hypothetical protein n=1 Tax=Paludisphaera borealis TaxID=1387353 RepID=UPI0028478CB1|nr:hypothetical protein [Paludisphaera borealis]MDR3622772.1 hypothetical protein [Paludisphaera borealis]
MVAGIASLVVLYRASRSRRGGGGWALVGVVAGVLSSLLALAIWARQASDRAREVTQVQEIRGHQEFAQKQLQPTPGHAVEADQPPLGSISTGVQPDGASPDLGEPKAPGLRGLLPSPPEDDLTTPR